MKKTVKFCIDELLSFKFLRYSREAPLLMVKEQQEQAEVAMAQIKDFNLTTDTLTCFFHIYFVNIWNILKYVSITHLFLVSLY